MIVSDAAKIDANVADEAAEWLLRLQEGTLDDTARADFIAWHDRSRAHALAWRRAEELLTLSNTAPDGLLRDAMRRLRTLNRRQALRVLAVLLVAPPVAWRAGQQIPQWSADLRTRKGEQRRQSLPDGTQLVLNSGSAVDVIYAETERRLRLYAGEILVTTQSDTDVPARPFRVQTAQGELRALGTRFSVRQFDDFTRVAVLEKTVEITPRNEGKQLLKAGEQADFSLDGIGPYGAVASTATAWEHALFVADRLELKDLVDELARHRTGILRTHPAVADLPVSGTFPIDDTDRALSLLEGTIAVKIDRRMPYWVTIQPR